MDIQCPNCGSYLIKERNHAQKTLGAIGTIAGATAGIGAVLSGGRLGVKLGMVTGSHDSAAGIVLGGIFSALVSGSLGCELGATVGKRIDQSILNNYVCCSCKCKFSQANDSPEADRIQPYHFT